MKRERPSEKDVSECGKRGGRSEQNNILENI